MTGAAPRPVVALIDGRSGSGKTELAAAIVAGWPLAQLVRLDDLYPGWDGLEAGSEYVRDHILASPSPRWQRWDWSSNSYAEWHTLDVRRPILIEGVGALSRANRSFATTALWVELDDETRKRRALERDGESFIPHWERWAAQEERFIAREDPAALADSVVDGRSVAEAAVVWRGILDPARVGQ